MSALQGGVGVLVLIATGIAALVAIGHYIRKGVRTTLNFFHRLERVVLSVESQLYENGGSSARDALNRIQAHLGIPNVTTDSHKEPKP